METKISCIGSGIMGTALMKGAATIVSPENIGFSDIVISKAQAAATSGGLVYYSNIEAVEKGDIVFLAIKPQNLKEVLEEIAPVVKKRYEAGNTPVFVSMAPGWSIAKILELLAVKVPIVRIMPNTPAIISKGFIAMCISPEVEVPLER